jgi:hypothetical protein
MALVFIALGFQYPACDAIDSLANRKNRHPDRCLNGVETSLCPSLPPQYSPVIAGYVFLLSPPDGRDRAVRRSWQSGIDTAHLFNQRHTPPASYITRDTPVRHSAAALLRVGWRGREESDTTGKAGGLRL